jgi:hypothetical protein
MESYLNKRARVSSEAVTGEGDLVSDVAAGRQKLATLKEMNCRTICARAKTRAARQRTQ